MTVYQWDSRNRLTQIVEYADATDADNDVDAIQTIVYRYDMFNRRIGKQVFDDTNTLVKNERFVWDGGNVALDFNDADLDGTAERTELSARYLWGQQVDQFFAQENFDDVMSDGETLWGLTDNLGTVRDLAAYDSGIGDTTIVDHRTYSAFGELTSGNAALSRYSFTAQEYDADTGMYYYDNRWYDQNVGQFISPDPILDDPTNDYRYIRNNPVNGTDPSGLDVDADSDLLNKILLDVENDPQLSHMYKLFKEAGKSFSVRNYAWYEVFGLMHYDIDDCGGGEYEIRTWTSAKSEESMKTLIVTKLVEHYVYKHLGPQLEKLASEREIVKGSSISNNDGSTDTAEVRALKLGNKFKELHFQYLVQPNDGSKREDLDAEFKKNNLTPPLQGYMRYMELQELIQAAGSAASTISVVRTRMSSRATSVEGSYCSKATNRAVIGKEKDIKVLQVGEKTLLPHLPNQGTPKANWEQNSRVLRREMSKGLPIRDASVGKNGELIDYPKSFLNAERNLLKEHGWNYSPTTQTWNPPDAK